MFFLFSILLFLSYFFCAGLGALCYFAPKLFFSLTSTYHFFISLVFAASLVANLLCCREVKGLLTWTVIFFTTVLAMIVASAFSLSQHYYFGIAGLILCVIIIIMMARQFLKTLFFVVPAIR